MVNDQNENSIRVLLGDAQTEYMPDEMRSKTLSPIHVATLSGTVEIIFNYLYLIPYSI